jgi:hypothetical protein
MGFESKSLGTELVPSQKYGLWVMTGMGYDRFDCSVVYEGVKRIKRVL